MKILCKNKYWNISEDYDIDKILYLLIDRPNKNNHWNDFVWENIKGQSHRDYDLPFCICGNENVLFKKYGSYHRENNKPAIIFYHGINQYYFHGYYSK